MDVIKMVEEKDYVGLKRYVEARSKELFDKRVELKKAHLKESLSNKQ